MNFWSTYGGGDKKKKKGKTTPQFVKKYNNNNLLKSANLYEEEVTERSDNSERKKKKDEPLDFIPFDTFSKKKKFNFDTEKFYGKKIAKIESESTEEDTSSPKKIPTAITGSEFEPNEEFRDSEGENFDQINNLDIVIPNPEESQEIVTYEVDITPTYEEENRCFFCDYYARSDDVEDQNADIKLMLSMIEKMHGASNIIIEQVAKSVERFYYNKIYLVRKSVAKKGTEIPILTAQEVIRHFKEHLIFSPSVYYCNVFQSLYTVHEKQKDSLFYKDTNGKQVPHEKNINTFLRVIDMMNRIQKTDLKESPFYAGDGMSYTMKEKGMFLNSGSELTEEHKKVFNTWKEEKYVPLTKKNPQ